MSLREKVAKGAVWSAFQDWGSQGIQFVVFFILARLLGPQTFGLIALAQIFLRLIQSLTKQGFTQVLIQKDNLDRSELDTAFWSNIGITSVLTAVCVVLAQQVSVWFKEPMLAQIIPWLSANFILVALNDVQRALLMREFDYKTIATRTFIAAPISGVIGISMAFSGYGVWSLVGKTLSENAVTVILLWQVSDWRPSFNFSIARFKELFEFQINIVGISVLGTINGQIDNFLVGYYIDSTTLGYYVVANKVVVLVADLLGGATQKIALPMFSRLRADLDKLQKIFCKITQVVSFIAFPVFFGIAILASEITFVAFGPEWAPAIPLMQILAFAGLQNSVYSFLGELTTAFGKPAWNLRIGFASVVFKAVGFMIAVQSGIVAVAVVQMMVGYVFTPIRLFFVNRLTHISFSKYLKSHVSPLLGVVIMSGMIISAKYLLGDFLNIYVALGVYVVVGAVSYLASIFIIDRQLIQDIIQFAQAAFLRQRKVKA
ncbi:lipopolysaccharide biosynthesis protein [Leptolyngbya sp. BC1307]|uniref:lipopolysaccharide biosynthesis protein n=1 Tax=Leptolyngbya sp. BC1307 TaxID=2029589 RepID=UPI001140C656|nr:lipopolysaccharide biosynthesis protein [Leptolyngbya sp. BC1307]